MCGFVLFDTQLIIEKRRMGSKDFVQHALELFIDFIGLFRRLLIILTQKVILYNTLFAVVLINIKLLYYFVLLTIFEYCKKKKSMLQTLDINIFFESSFHSFSLIIVLHCANK